MSITDRTKKYPIRSGFTDTVYGYTVYAKSKIAAWMLIRNICHDLDLEVPTVDQIIEMGASASASISGEDFRKEVLK